MKPTQRTIDNVRRTKFFTESASDAVVLGYYAKEDSGVRHVSTGAAIDCQRWSSWCC